MLSKKQATALIFLYYVWFTVTYDVKTLKNDLSTVDLNELLQYRGPILKHIWYNDSHITHGHHEKSLCHSLFVDALKTKNVSWPPPKMPPEELLDMYTMRKAHFADWYFAQKYNGGVGYDWSTNVVEEFMRKPNICGGYRVNTCVVTMETYQHYINDKVCLVIGSESPWAEAALLNLKAKHVITIEYMEIKTDYPKLTTYHPSTVAELNIKNLWEPVDLIFSFSSLEHDGLGRYGDPLNPFGDLESVARARCLLKPRGILMLGVPMAPDTVLWNAHRTYGKYRLALLTMGFDILDLIGTFCYIEEHAVRGGDVCQPIIVLQKTEAIHTN
mmetsp:Transcript_18459/g.26590  ORF Transcript_18459/g.26590 Transcript_18459/m.26590 type:complete len:329 (+) Transcript_18459:35-1021(+)